MKGKNVIIPLPILEYIISATTMTYLLYRYEFVITAGYIWYIKGPEEKIIVDTGGKAESLVRLGIFSRQLQTPREALSRVGITPEEIDKVIITHLHLDHAEYMNLFPNAEIIVQKDELLFAKNPHPIQYFAYAPVQPLLGKVKLRVIDGDAEIADGISVMKTPGHTPGTQSVIVKTEKGDVIITGFCCIKRNFEPPEAVKHIMPVIAPGYHIDLREAYENVLKVKRKANIIVPNHDREYIGVEKIP